MSDAPSLKHLRLFCLARKIRVKNLRAVSKSMSCAVTVDCKVLVCKQLAKDAHAVLFGQEFLPAKQQILVRHALQKISATKAQNR